MPRDFSWLDAIGSGRGNRAVGEIIETVRMCGRIDPWRSVGNKRAARRLDGESAGPCQSVISMPDGVQINSERDRNLAHGGHSFTRFDDTRPDGPEHLVAYLHVDRNARLFDVKGV